MKRIIIICEGQTEQEFCKKVLIDHFGTKQITIQLPTIKKSGGGIVSWNALKKEVEIHLKKDRTAIVTTLIDYYGIHEKLGFPGWAKAQLVVDRGERMDYLESCMKNEVSEEIRYRFIPYLQLHEFEGLLFSSLEVFQKNFTPEELDYQMLKTIIDQYPNPEEINDNPNTAPSKRLTKIVRGYNKVLYGPILAEAIGLEKIRNKCPRFHQWITRLESD